MNLVLLKADAKDSQFTIYSPVVNGIIVGYGTNSTVAIIDGGVILNNIIVSEGATLTINDGDFIEYSGTGSFNGTVSGNVYTVMYNSNGGTGLMPNAHFAYGGSFTPASCTFTSPSGKVFDFWSTSDSGSEVSSIDNNETLYAIWKNAPAPYVPPFTPPTPEPQPGTEVKPVVDGNTTGTVTTTTDDKGNVTVKTELKDTITGVETEAVKTGESTEIRTTIPSSAVKTEDGTVAKISDSAIESALKQVDLAANDTGIENAKPTIEIVVTGGDKTEIIVEISAESLKTVSDTGAGVSISSNSGKVVLNSDAASTISENTGNVSIMLGQATSDDLNEKQKAKAGDKAVIKIEASVGESLIHELGGKATITVPYELRNGEDPEKIVIFYLDNDGNMTEMNATYNAATKEVSFETTHFSYYMVSFKEDVSLSSIDMNIVLIAVGVLVVLAIASFLYYRRNNSA